jgi:hypothetical protein
MATNYNRGRGKISSRIEEAISRRDKELDTVTSETARRIEQLHKAREEAVAKRIEDLQEIKESIAELEVEKYKYSQTGRQKEAAVLQTQISDLKDSEVNLTRRGSLNLDRLFEKREQSDMQRRSEITAAQQGFERSMASAMSTRQTASEISQARSREEVRRKAIDQASRPEISTFELQRNIERRRELLKTAQGRVLESARGQTLESTLEYDERKGAVLDDKAQAELAFGRRVSPLLSQRIGVEQRIKGSIAQDEETLAERKRLGLDIYSRFSRASARAEQVETTERQGMLRREVLGGQYNKADIDKEVAEKTRELITTFSELNKAFKEGSENADMLSASFEKVDSELKEKQFIQRELARVPSGRDISDTLGYVGRQFQGVGAALSTAGETYGYGTVGVQEQLMANRTAFAERANQINRDAISAAQGDFSAIRRVLTGQIEQEASYGAQIGNMQDTAQGFGLLGSGAVALGAITSEGGDLASRFITGSAINPLMGLKAAASGALEDMGQAAPSIGGFLNNAADYRFQIQQKRAELGAQQQARALDSAINALSDEAGQAGLEYTISVAEATRGLGRGQVGARRDRPLLETGQALQDRSANIQESTLGFFSGVDLDFRDTQRESYSREYRGSSIRRMTPEDQAIRSRNVDRGISDKFMDFVDFTESLGNAIPQSSRSAYNGPLRPLSEGMDGIMREGGESATDRRSRLQQALRDPAEIAEESGLTQQQLIGLVGQSIQGLGSQFSRDPEQLERLEEAGRLARSGYLRSPEQAIEFQTKLTRLGGDETDTRMRSVMESAFAAGFDNSTAFSELVNVATETAANTKATASGIDVTSAASNIASIAFQAGDRGMNEFQRARSAQTAIGRISDVMTSGDMSFGNVMERQYLQQGLEGADTLQIEQISRMSPAEIRALNEAFAKGDEAGQRYIQQNFPGLQGTLKTGEDIEAVNKAGRANVVFGSGYTLGVGGEGVPALKKFIETGDKSAFDNLDSKTRNNILSMLQMEYGKPDIAIGAITATTSADDPQRRALDQRAQISAEQLRNARAEGQATVTSAGVEQVEDVGISNVAKIMKEAADQIDFGAFKKAAETAASDLSVSHTAFKTELESMTGNVKFITDALMEIGTSLGLVKIDTNSRGRYNFGGNRRGR